MKKLVLALAVIASIGMISCDSQNQNAEAKGEVPAENIENVEPAPVENAEVVTEENKEAQADEQKAEEQKAEEKTEEAPAEPAK